jgi:serine phosphatase RsbU (regulator of sigma subunit)
MTTLSIDERIALLKHCRFLAAAPAGMLETLVDSARVENVAKGEAVVTAGESGRTMYVISTGRASVHQENVVLAELGQGDLFGEMTVLDEQVRSASVTALEDSTLLAIDRAALFAALKEFPESFEGIMHAVLQRERTIVEDVRTRTERLMGYQKELEIGRKIQADFLPVSIPEVEHWEISPFFEAAREVAGDFYDVFQLPDSGHLALVIGDVCDKGVGAALYMSLFRSLIRATAMHGYFEPEGKSQDAADEGCERAGTLLNTIETTNRYIAVTHPKSSMFASIFFGLLDPDTGELKYINAGHESPVVYRADGSQEILEVNGGVLGLFAMAPFTVSSVQLEPGDLLYSYTDGVNEAKDTENAQFGDDRIQEMDAPWEGSAQSFVEEIYQRIKAFRGTAPPSDDITMLALRRVS